MARLTKNETEKRKELAELIFLSDANLTQKEVAKKVGVTEKTITSWIEVGKWKDKRKSLLVTKKNLILEYHDQIERLNNEIKTRKIIFDIPLHLTKPIKMKDSEGGDYLHYQTYNKLDFPIKIGNTATAAEASIVAQITNAIKKLETETEVGEIIQVGVEFLGFIKPHDLEFAKKFSTLYDSFIQSKI